MNVHPEREAPQFVTDREPKVLPAVRGAPNNV